jgi:hypothetical protein
VLAGPAAGGSGYLLQSQKAFSPHAGTALKMGKKEYHVVSIQPDEYPEWNKFVETSPSGSVYHLSSYISVLAQVTGCRFRIVGVRLNDTIIAGAALFEIPLLIGCYASSRSLLYYHGIVLGSGAFHKNSTEVRVNVLESLEKALHTMGYAAVSMNHRHPIYDLRFFDREGWNLQVGYTYEVQISDVDALWRNIDQNQRRLIRRAEKKSYTLSEDDDFDSFFKQHQAIHERKGASLYLKKRQFEKYFHLLKKEGLCRLYHARTRENESAASQLVLLSGHPVTHTVGAGSRKQFLSDGATSFLRWRVFDALSKEGYDANDLTDASVSSVARFKRDMGGELKMCIRASKRFSKTWWPNHFVSRALNKVKKIF